MNIGISSMSFCVAPFEEMLDRIGARFKTWEIFSEAGHSLSTIKDEFLKRAPSYKLDYQAHAPFVDLNIASVNESVRRASVDDLKRTIESARVLGIKTVTLHPGHPSMIGAKMVNSVVKWQREALYALSKCAHDNGVKLALENMPAGFWGNAENCDDLLEFIDGLGMGICWDIGHSFLASSSDTFLSNAGMLSNVHIHDNTGRWDEHLPIGKGKIDFERLLKALSSKNYQGKLIIECRSFEEGLESLAALESLVAKCEH